MNIHIDSPTVILLPLASFTSFFVLNIIEVWLIYNDVPISSVSFCLSLFCLKAGHKFPFMKVFPPLLSTAYTPPGSRGGPHLEDDTDVLAQRVHVLEGELEGNGVGVEVGTVLPPSRG